MIARRTRGRAMGVAAGAMAVLALAFVLSGARARTPVTKHGAGPQSLDTVVTRITDGDTLYVADLPERVRLIGIDTPETNPPECYGREAGAHLRELAPPGTRVLVEFDVERHDRHGRPLGYLWRTDDGVHINLAMLADGFAEAITVPPNDAYAQEFQAAEGAAREGGLGLWSAC